MLRQIPESPMSAPVSPESHAHSELLQIVARIVGPRHVLTDHAEREFYSQDVHSRGETALAVVQPGSTDELSELLRAIEPTGLPIAVRGGGMSYTSGYIPSRPNAVMIDLHRLNRIVEINERDMYVTVECGVTWKQLYEALKAVGRRTPYWGALSGLRSTVGGALSQGSMFLGSGRYGTAGESCIGLDVVQVNGEVLHLGSHANRHGKPFFRQYGPDLMGLFLSDAGALGIKARATLRLVRHEPAAGHLSFAFEDAQSLFDVMTKISSLEVASECYAFNSTLHDMFTRSAGLSSDLKMLGNVIRKDGLRAGLGVALAGRRFLRGVAYSLHVSVDADDLGAAQAKLAVIQDALGKSAHALEPSIPKLLRMEPFPEVTGMLGPAGERWVNVHGTVPNSGAEAMLTACEAVFARHAADMSRLNIVHGYLFCNVALAGILIEPVLYWPDARDVFHDRVLPADYLSGLRTFTANPAAREVVNTLRDELKHAFLEQGAVSFQLGKFYDYQAALDPSARTLLHAIKRLVDPHGRMNPDNLGLTPLQQ
jgi:glycolate oxidase